MAIVEIKMEASATPAPSHGGDVRWLTWRLVVNGVTAMHERTRVPWRHDFDPAQSGAKIPPELEAMNVALTKALS